MPEYFCVCLGVGAWALLILLSTFVASELRADHTNSGDGLALPERAAETAVRTTA
jgi:hypothetical protein